MIGHLLRNTDVADVVKLCSPSLFNVLSMRAVMGELRALSASRAEATHRALLLSHGQAHRACGVEVGGSGEFASPSKTGSSAAENKAFGEAVLRLYFRELFDFDETLIDFRPSALNFRQATLRWLPAPMSIGWDPKFIASLRGVYRGFYLSNDVLFRSSLQALGLLPAEQLFRKHFGEGDQSAVTFSTRDFTRTFGDVFETCARDGSKLHSNFLPFGFVLASLFQTLETLNCAFDVRAAFQQTVQDD
jgi:hypothetical protein